LSITVLTITRVSAQKVCHRFCKRWVAHLQNCDPFNNVTQRIQNKLHLLHIAAAQPLVMSLRAHRNGQMYTTCQSEDCRDGSELINTARQSNDSRDAYMLLIQKNFQFII